MSDTSDKSIESREDRVDIPDHAYGYRFFDREEVDQDGELLGGKNKNHSNWFFLGEIFDKERVEK